MTETTHIFCYRLEHSYPKEVLKKKLQPGEIVAQEKNCGIIVLKWRDTRDVRDLSTKHTPKMEETQRSRKGRSNSEPNTPSTFAARRASTTRSKLKAKASVLKKGMKWYRKLVFELLLGVAVVSVGVIFKKLALA